MSKTCQDCQWFRPFRPRTQTLSRDLGVAEPQSVEEAAVQELILTFMQEEWRKQGAELKEKVELVRLGQSKLLQLEESEQTQRYDEQPPEVQELQKWVTRPSMTDHCGL